MKWSATITATVLLIASPAFMCAADSPAIPLTAPTLAPLLEKVRPGVVTIHVIGARYQEGELDQNSGPVAPAKQPFKSGGSGVIFDAQRGLIGTNHHVISDALTIRVGLHDGRITDGHLIGTDVATDIAILKIDLPDLREVPLGNSDNLRVGDYVVAIGSPFGLEGTATAGIVSGLMRSDVGYEMFESFIQVDAAVNPGNSGGALVNLQGELIGINTAIAGGRNIGIGFAIPINMARRIGRQILLHGYMPRGSIGLSTADVSLEMAHTLRLRGAKGALVTDVVAQSPADAAGLKPGDIIVSVGGEEVRTNSGYLARVGSTALGESLELKLISEGKTKAASLTISDIKVQPALVTIPAEAKVLGGLVVASIGPGSRHYGKLRGAVVTSLVGKSAAEASGMRAGDVITAIDEAHISEAGEVARIAVAKGAERVKINREGVPYWVRLSRPASK